MKKTLITLAALAMASVASAASVSDATIDTTSNYSTESAFTTNNGAFTMTLVLDWEKLSALTDATQVLYSARHDSWWGDVCYSKVNVKNGTVTLAEGPDNSTSLTLAETYAVGGDVAVTYTFAGGDTKTLTLSVLSGDTLTSTTITTGWNVSQAFDRLTINTNSGLVERALVFDSALSTSDIIAISKDVLPEIPDTPGDDVTPDTPAIPEPTTATLSLLALAGLAARRRRK